MIDLTTAAIGTAHPGATCCWCAGPLVVAQVLQLRCWVCPTDWRRQVAHATIVKAASKEHAKLLGVTIGTEVCLDVPLPSQAQIEERIAAFRTEYPGKRLNLTWGGQAGPGKTHGIRWLLYRRSLQTPHHEALLLRENWEQLEKTHIRKMKEELPKLGARLVDRTANFANGAYIDCGHMADQEAIGRYLSTGYGIIAPDEASLYPVDHEGIPVIAELSTRAREAWVGLDGQKTVPLFIPVTNPGGPSAFWLLDMCIDHTPDFERFPALAQENADGTPVYNPDHWQYQAAKLDDNPYMRPDYATTDLAVLSKFRYEQLRHGDWHVFAGQFFSKWNERKHLADMDLPAGLTWFTAMDWGSLSPGCVLWFAVLPDRRVYLRSELKFQGDDVAEVADKIKRRESELGITGKVSYRVGDPAMWIKDAKTKGVHLVGESIADTFRLHGISLRQADNDRVNGWARCLQLLRDAPDGTPWFQAHPDCRYFARTIAAARSDKSNPEDVDTSGDDHALDAWRYGAMSRPSPRAGSAVGTLPVGSIGWWKTRMQPKTGVLSRPNAA